MPNTPMQVGEGCTTYTPGSNVTQSDIEKVQLILGSLGVAQQVPEKLINPAGRYCHEKKSRLTSRRLNSN